MTKNSKTIAFTIADNNNLKFYENLKSSWKHFHPDIELKLIGGEELNSRLKGDPFFFYRATPIIGSELLKQGYETVLKIDCDSILLSDLNHIFEDEETYDIGVVLNDTPLRVWDIASYYNCGLVVMKSLNFVEHWKYLCLSPHFNNYQYREQDLLSIITSDYFPYKVKCYDQGERLNGLVAKPIWAKCYMKDGKVMVPTDLGEKQLSVIHFAGGNDPVKGNYRTRFQEDVVKYIDEIINPSRKA